MLKSHAFRYLVGICIGLSFIGAMHAAPNPTPWSNNLYLGRNGYWKQRLMVEVTNRSGRTLAGESVSLTIGTQTDQAQLVKADARSIRVVDASGRELLWLLTNEQGTSITEGPIPDGAKLVIPVDGPSTAISRYFIYFDNPQAWAVPDFLKGTGQLVNGGVELGQGTTPTGWRHDSADEQHSASWSTESPHSGSHCLKLSVTANAAPSWISTRQDGIRLVAGAKYTLNGWLRTENVIGSVGIYIHVGNTGNYMMISPMASGKAGTNDWQQVSTEFTVPTDAYMADLGTVLYGTGTAWFDDITLQTSTSSTGISVKVYKPERMVLTERLSPAVWPQGMEWCAPVRLFNFTNHLAQSGMVSVDMAGIKSRMGRTADISRIVVSDGVRKYPCTLLRDTLLISGVNLPAKCVVNLGLFAPAIMSGKANVSTVAATRSTGTSEDTRQISANGKSITTGGMSIKSYEVLINSSKNLVMNPSLDAGSQFPDSWQGGVEGKSA